MSVGITSATRVCSLISCLSQLLDKLPHTVRGMGVALLGGHQPIDFGEGLQQGKRHRLGNLAGFIVVVREKRRSWLYSNCARYDTRFSLAMKEAVVEP